LDFVSPPKEEVVVATTARFGNVVCLDGEFGRVDVYLVVDEKEDDGGWRSVAWV